MSELRINVAKSTVFAAGRGRQELESEAAVCGLSILALPVGVPSHYKVDGEG